VTPKLILVVDDKCGFDLNTVRELMRHKSLKMTLRYAHLSPGFKQAAVERLDTYWTPDDTLRNVVREVERSKSFELKEEGVVGGTGLEPVTPTMSRESESNR